MVTTAPPSSLPLFSQTEADLPWLPLAQLPTPVERLSRLGPELGIGELWIKRDDLSSSLYGGNKVRKLEFLLADALAKGARRVVTIGAAGSHHLLATTRFAHALGLRAESFTLDQVWTPHVAHNQALGVHWGVRHTRCPHEALVPAFIAWARSRGDYVIPPGGSSPLGTLGYVNAALELAAQLAAGAMPVPRAIVVASGSGGTHAGLVAGLALAGLAIPVIGVRVVPRLFANRCRLSRLAAGALRLLGRTVRLPELVLHHGAFGGGYGHPTEAGERVTGAAFALEGLALEPTYTAKALAGAAAWCRLSGERGPVLYWHTYDSVEAAPVARI